MFAKIFALAVAVVGVVTGLLDVEALSLLPLFGLATTHTFDIDEGMKVVFEDALDNNTITDTEALDLFEQDMNVKVDETTGGRYIETAQLFGLPAGVGARAEGEYIPVPQGPTIVNSRINLKKVQATLEMTGDVMDVVKTNEAAFVNYAERAMPMVAELLDDDLDRQSLGYGAGIIARVNEATPTDVDMILDSSYGIAGYEKEWTLFQENSTYVFSPNLDGSSKRTGGSVTSSKVISVDPSTRTVTFDAVPNDVADNDYIFKGDASGQSSQTAAGANREMMGLLGIIDDGGILNLFQNISRTTYRRWRAYVKDASAAGLTEDLLVETDDEAFEIGKAEAKVILTARKHLRQYWADLKSDRSINDPRGSFTGGLNGKGLNTHLGDRVVNLRASRKLPEGVAFGIDPSVLKRFHNVGFKWDDKTGSVWNRVSDGVGAKDAFFATGYLRMELACSAPHKQFRIDNLLT